MRYLAKTILDGLVMATAVMIGYTASVWLHIPREIMLLDRPRQVMDSPDIVSRFLMVTGTPHHFKQGFVVLPAKPAVEDQLYRLLDALGQCIKIARQNQQAIIVPGSTTPRGFTLEMNGMVETFPDIRPGYSAQDKEQRLNEWIAVEEDLRRQYETVVAAVRQLRPGAVGSPISSEASAGTDRGNSSSPDSMVKPAAHASRNEEPSPFPLIVGNATDMPRLTNPESVPTSPAQIRRSAMQDPEVRKASVNLPANSPPPNLSAGEKKAKGQLEETEVVPDELVP